MPDVKFVWNNPPEDVFANLFDNHTQMIRRGVAIILQKRAADIEAWMKENAIWTDRTANARQTLWASDVMVELFSIAIEFGHGMDYGWWLEMANAGRYSVILPALDHWAPIIKDDLNQMMGH